MIYIYSFHYYYSFYWYNFCYQFDSLKYSFILVEVVSLLRLHISLSFQSSRGSEVYLDSAPQRLLQLAVLFRSEDEGCEATLNQFAEVLWMKIWILAPLFAEKWLAQMPVMCLLSEHFDVVGKLSSKRPESMSALSTCPSPQPPSVSPSDVVYEHAKCGKNSFSNSYLLSLQFQLIQIKDESHSPPSAVNSIDLTYRTSQTHFCRTSLLRETTKNSCKFSFLRILDKPHSTAM